MANVFTSWWKSYLSKSRCIVIIFSGNLHLIDFYINYTHVAKKFLQCFISQSNFNTFLWLSLFFHFIYLVINSLCFLTLDEIGIRTHYCFCTESWPLVFRRKCVFLFKNSNFLGKKLFVGNWKISWNARFSFFKNQETLWKKIYFKSYLPSEVKKKWMLFLEASLFFIYFKEIFI